MNRAERHHLVGVITDLQAWCDDAREVRQLHAHLPLSEVIDLGTDGAHVNSLAATAMSADIAEASKLTSTTWFDGRKSLVEAHAAADRLRTLHQDLSGVAAGQRLAGWRDSLRGRLSQERTAAYAVLAELRTARTTAEQMLYDATHLPFRHLGAVPDDAQVAARSLVDLVTEHEAGARVVVEGVSCLDGTCLHGHSSARLLAEVHVEATASGVFELVNTWATWASSQRQAQLAVLPAVVAEVAQLEAHANRTIRGVEHLALTRSGALADQEIALLGQVRTTSARHLADARVFLRAQLCDRSACAHHHAAVAEVARLHFELGATGRSEVLELADRISRRGDEEHSRLKEMVDTLQSWSAAAATALHVEAHRLVTTGPLLDEAERGAARSVQDMSSQHLAKARVLLDSSACADATCADAHLSAALLGWLHADLDRSGAGAALPALAERARDLFTHERTALARAVDDVVAWHARAVEARFYERHMPLSGSQVLTAEERVALYALDRVVTDDVVCRRLLEPQTCADGACTDLHEAARRLAAFHSGFATEARSVDAAATRLSEQVALEREILAATVDDVAGWHVAAVEARRLEHHMPLSGPEVLTPDERSAVDDLEQVVATQLAHSRMMLDPVVCGTETCVGLHPSARRMARFHPTFAPRAAMIFEAVNRLGTQTTTEQRQVLGLRARLATCPTRSTGSVEPAPRRRSSLTSASPRSSRPRRRSVRRPVGSSSSPCARETRSWSTISRCYATLH